MPDSIMYRQDAYVVLEPNQPEQFLTLEELLEKLQAILADRPDNLPPDLQHFTSVQQQAQYLLETYCELDMEPGQYLQWYAIRMEK